MGVDLVVGYGGDGTQHELANAVIGTATPMAVLPGGTGNGFARELGIPKELRAAVELICTGGRVRQIDVGRIGEQYFIQRMYAGVEPEEQTSREHEGSPRPAGVCDSGAKTVAPCARTRTFA